MAAPLCSSHGGSVADGILDSWLADKLSKKQTPEVDVRS